MVARIRNKSPTAIELIGAIIFQPQEESFTLWLTEEDPVIKETRCCMKFTAEWALSKFKIKLKLQSKFDILKNRSWLENFKKYLFIY
jgi:hypothetical protein